MQFDPTLWLLLVGLQAVTAQLENLQNEPLFENDGETLDANGVNLTGAFRQLQYETELYPAVYSGNYKISGCHEHHHASLLQVFIPQFQYALKVAIVEAKKGRSSPAYAAFFKSDVNKDLVVEKLEKVATGASVRIRDGSLRNLEVRCVGPKDKVLFQLFCEQHRVRLFFYAAFSAGICPAFFGERPDWGSNIACPSVRNNRFQESQSDERSEFLSSQLSDWVYQFVLVYLYADDKISAAGYWAQECVDLSAAESIKNPANYAWFVGGMSHAASQNPFLHSYEF